MLFNPFNRRGNGTEALSGSEPQASGRRESLAARLQQECAQLTAQFRTAASFGYDADARTWWVRLAGLPLAQRPAEAPVPAIVLLSDNYPVEGPGGVFLPRSLSWADSLMAPALAESRDAGVASAGWARCDIPGQSWRETDNLCRLLEIVVAVLSAVQQVTLTLGAEPGHDNGTVTRPSLTKGETG